MPNHTIFELVKLEPDFDCLELVKLEQLNAVEDVKIKTESINDETVIKQEFLESVKHEILDDETVIKQEVLESIKHETVDMVLDGAATDNDPDNTLVSSVFICEYCHKNYTQRQNFDAHIATHHQNELGELKKGRLANKKSKNQRRAKSTVKCDRKATAEPPVPRYDETREVHSCKYCNKTYAHMVNFGSHFLAAHKDQLEDLNSEITNIIHKCQQCDYKTLRLDNFKRHMLHHSGVSLFKCEFCGKGYKIKSFLDSHLLKQHKKEIGATEDVILSKIYTCKTCEYKTVRLNDYKQHILNHHATSTKRTLFKCELCDFKSVHKRSLLRHNFVHSGGGKLYSCEFCERTYKQKRNLRAHVYADHKDKSGNLIEAILNKVHQCPHCPYKTMYTSHLKRHHIVTHEKDSEWKRLLLKCEICGYETLDKSKLNRHMWRHSNVKKYACSECDNGFNFKSAMDAHILAKHSDNQELMNSITATVYECNDCSYKTVRTENMKRHRKTHLAAVNDDPDDIPESSVFVCEYSHKNFTQSRKLDSHIAALHKNELGELNNLCLANKKGKNDRKKSNVKCESKTSADPPLSTYQGRHKVYSCKYCVRTFDRQINIDSHVFTTHRDQVDDLQQEIKSKIHKCEQCDYETVRIELIKRHTLSHSDATLFKCDFCGKGYTRRWSLDSHLLQQHKKEIENTGGVYKVRQCPKCPYKTKHSSHFKRHVVMRHGEEAERLELTCEVCGYKTVDKSALKRHLWIHSDPTTLKIHQCPNCPYKTMHRSHLKRHIAMRHGEDSKLEICEVCGYKTVDRSTLNRHMLKHSNVRDYVCSECDNGFNFKYDMDAHILAKHRDNQELMNSITTAMYECNDCSYRTVRANNIKRHKNTHL